MRPDAGDHIAVQQTKPSVGQVRDFATTRIQPACLGVRVGDRLRDLMGKNQRLLAELAQVLVRYSSVWIRDDGVVNRGPGGIGEDIVVAGKVGNAILAAGRHRNARRGVKDVQLIGAGSDDVPRGDFAADDLTDLAIVDGVAGGILIDNVEIIVITSNMSMCVKPNQMSWYLLICSNKDAVVCSTKDLN